MDKDITAKVETAEVEKAKEHLNQPFPHSSQVHLTFDKDLRLELVQNCVFSTLLLLLR